MLNRFRDIFYIDAFLALVFLGENTYVWERLNGQYPIIGSVHADPFWITFTQSMVFSGGTWVDLHDVINLPNLPFWIFFVTVAMNLIFIYSLQRSKETKQNPSQNAPLT